MIPTYQLGQFGRAGAQATVSAPLDALDLTNLYCAIGFVKLRTAFAGSALRVRRSSDNAEQDIGFTGLALNTSALSAFVGANSAFIVTMYDQGAGGNNWTQATANRQPRIVNAGVYDGKAVFDGTNDYLATSVASSAVPALTTFLLGNLRSTTGVKVIYEMAGGAPVGGDNVLQHYISSNLNRVVVSEGANFVESTYSPFPTNNVHSARADRSQGTNAGKTKLYVNGVQQSPTASSTSGGLPTGNFTSETWVIGSRAADDSLAAQLDLRSFIVFVEDRTDIAVIAGRVLAAG